MEVNKLNPVQKATYFLKKSNVGKSEECRVTVKTSLISLKSIRPNKTEIKLIAEKKLVNMSTGLEPSACITTLHNVCAQYTGGCAVHRGMFSTLGGYHEYSGGYHEYTGGYHEYTGGCSVHRGIS